MKTVHIYIDTSIKGPRRRDGVVQYILAFEASNGKTADMGDKIKKEDTTENQLTLLGLEAALKRLNTACRLVLHLENTHVAAVLKNKWYEQWKYNGWMSKKNEPICDAETWESIQYLLNAHEFEVVLKQEHTYRDWMRRELRKEK